MIISLSIIILALAWLLYETDYMRGRLPVGEAKPCPSYASYTAYSILRKGKPNWNETALHKGNNFPEGYSPNGEPEYTIILNPGITNVLCGWEWVDEHCADMVNYMPEVFMTIGNVRYNMTIKQPSIIKDIMRVNKLTKKQKLAYA